MIFSKIGYKKFLLVFLLILSPFLCAEEVIINTPIKIDSTDLSFENKSIVIDGARVIINGTHKFTSLKIINYGSISHDVEKSLQLDVEGKIEVLSGEIDVSGKGLLADELASGLTGGSHIGYGGVIPGSVAGIAYGNFKTPTTSGRGGRSSSVFVDESNSSRGGGTIILKADELVLNGYIWSTGQSVDSFPVSVGGGAGGTIAIDVRKISGTGSINVMGMVGYSVTNDNNIGDGSGGIVSIKYQEASEPTTYDDYGYVLSDIQITAWGGHSGSRNYRGANGTIYLENKTTEKSKLYVQGYPYYEGINDEAVYFKTKTYLTGITSNIDLIFDRTAVYIADSNLPEISIVDGCKAGKAIIEFPQTISTNSINTNCEKGAYLGFQQDLNLSSSTITGSNERMELDVIGHLHTPDTTLTLSNTTLGLHQSHTFASLDLTNNSLVNSGFPATYTASIAPSALDISAQNISIDSTSAIDVSGNGIINRTATCGSYSHGGKGKNSPTEIYGEYAAPVTFGAGCISTDAISKIYGGGALKLTVNNLVLDGTIRANAAGMNGGSGGSIWINAENISRTAAITDSQIISANGSTDGGGGRVFIYSGNVEGIDLSLNTFAQGYSAGTVYLKDKQNANPPRLLVQNNALNPGALTSVNLGTEDKLVVKNANLRIGNFIPLSADIELENASLELNGQIEDLPQELLENATFAFIDPVRVSENFIWPSNSKLIFKNGLHLEGQIRNTNSSPLNNLSISVTGGISSDDDSLIINGYSLELVNSQEFNKIELLNGAVITTPQTSSPTQPVIELTASEFLIDETSKIDVSGKGLSFDPQNEQYDGASHGGKGGRTLWFADNKPAITHGSITQPSNYGYGAQIPAYGGPTFGGGAIKISAGIFTLEGKIVADGDQPYASNKGGSAAGGSVLIDVNKLQSETGNFIISASGGNGVDVAGGGGGGRVAIYYNEFENIDISRVRAFGGLAGNFDRAGHGEAGTIYLEEKDNSVNKEVRVIGSGSKSRYDMYDCLSANYLCPITTIPDLPENVAFLGEYINFDSQNNLNLKSLHFNASRVVINENFSVETLGLKNSIVDIYGQQNSISNELTLENRSNVTFINPLTSPADIRLSNVSTLNLKNSKAKNIAIYGDSNMMVSGNFDVDENINIFDSRMTVSGNLRVSGNTSVKSLASNIRIKSVDFPNAFLGNTLTLIENDQSNQLLSTRFRLIPVGYSEIAFELLENPGYFLRSTDAGLVLSQDDKSLLFKDQTTFNIERGFSNPSFTSFQSKFKPGSYLKHTGNQIVVAPVVNDAEYASATWNTNLEPHSYTGLIVVQPGFLTVGGNATFAGALTGDTYFSAKVAVNGRLSNNSPDLVVDGIDLALVGRYSYNNINIKNTASLSIPEDNSSVQYEGLELLANKVYVTADSLINVSSTSQITAYGQYTGGSHGGKGGRQTGMGAQLRGNEQQPVTKGAPGRADTFTCSVQGGGALKLTTDYLELNGKLLANGDVGSSYCGAAAGGSIWLIAKDIQSPSGLGEIHADGGVSTVSARGSGGGGRIALYYSTQSGVDFSRITANGGSALSTQDKGENGTVYIKTGSVPPYISNNTLPVLSNQLLGSFELTFSAPIQLTSFTTDDISISLIETPLNIIRPSSIDALSETVFVIHFTPVFGHGNYQLNISSSISGTNGLSLDQNRNLTGGETADAYKLNFGIDTENPLAPTLQPYPERHNTNKYIFTGTKEANSAILLNGNLVVNESAATSWTYNANLVQGNNQLNFTVRDKAGNISPPVTAQINYDDRAPGPVTITGLNGRADGRSIYVEWTGYDKEANGGDIREFEIYCSRSPFTNINGMYPCTTAYAHEQYKYIQNLALNTQYYVAVVAVDMGGLKTTNVTSIAATVADIVEPEISELNVIPGVNSLEISWTADISAGDIREYQIYYFNSNNQPKTIVLGREFYTGKSRLTYLLNGLNPATPHYIRVTAVDNSGNTSEALTDPGITLLTNPQNVRTKPLNNSAEIYWIAAHSNSLVKHYAIYAQATPFNNVTGMTPKVIVQPGAANVAAGSGVITGLINDVKHYVAVTAVNLSNGELKQVTAVPVTPQNDSEPPTINSTDFISTESALSMASNPVLRQSGKFIVTAQDNSRISRVNFALNGEPLGDVLITNSNGDYEQAIDLLSLEDGNYTLTVKVYDMADNLAEKNYSLVIDLNAPAIPVISAPMKDIATNQKRVQLSGNAATGAEVIIALNSVDSETPIVVDSNGNFSVGSDLTEGLNRLEVKARYIGRTKWSDYSSARNITVDSQIPAAPNGFSVTAANQGQVRLQWTPVISSNSSNSINGYRLYRSIKLFSSKSDADVELVNKNQLITAANFTDMVALDGKYFYAVSAINQAATESQLSNVLSVDIDSAPPKITQLTFTTEGEFDSVNAIYGRGKVIVNAIFSEPLRNSPYFAIAPHEGLPISVNLVKSYTDELAYTGEFQIDQSTASGMAYAAVSAFDVSGNRGTDIQQGNSLKIDTQGPDVAQLSITPLEPLKVDSVNGLLVNVSIRLSEKTKAATPIKLIPMIDGVVLNGYDQGIALIGGEDLLNFSGEFNLPNTIAQSANAQLSFSHFAIDGLNNISQKIIGQNQFQVYQGNLPPLNIPGNVIATALPGGKIKLQWRAVEKAAGYIIYRQGPGDTELKPLPFLSNTEYEDQTLEDGTYIYAVTSVRRENGQDAESGKSATVTAKADRVAPAKPAILSAELSGSGIVVRWSAPTIDEQNATQSSQGLTYNLYRTSLPQNAEVTDIALYTPIQKQIPALLALDTNPAEDQHSYFVTAVDAAGNESAPSSTVYHNAGLLPVNELHITLNNNDYPTLSWQHQSNSIDHYKVLRKTGESDAELLTPEGINRTGINSAYTDNSYNGNQVSQGASQEVLYSVIAIDEQNVESIAHDLRLPALSVKLERTKSILMERGVMNQLWFIVNNKGTSAANGIRLYVTLIENGIQREHKSEIFDIDAGITQRIPVVVGGYNKLDAITELLLRIEQKPKPNQRINIYQKESVDVHTSSLTMDLSTQYLTRGAEGKVSFSLVNNSDVDTELLMARNNAEDSDEVHLILEDLQGNLLNQKKIRQVSGGVINVPSGDTVARVGPKATFTSEDFTISIPAAAPDQVRLRLVVDKYHYQLGKENHVEISGSSISKDIQLKDTPYFATVTDVQPATVNAKNGMVTISGRVIDRLTNAPLANVPVSIVTSVRGFERMNTVYSDASGNYELIYKVEDISGKYRVSAIHPEMTDRPNHGSFIVESGTLDETDFSFKIPRNYEQEILLKINAGYYTTLRNVRLVQVPSGSQTVAEIPVGVSVNYTPIASISPNTNKEILLKLAGDNSAEEKGNITYRVEADGHTDTKALGYVNITYAFTQAFPAIIAKPAFVDTGVSLEGIQHENIQITNSGLDLLQNARIELLPTAESPVVPDWISLETAPNLGNLAKGESRTVQLKINPNATVAEDDYRFALQVKGDNFAQLPNPIPVFVKVTQSGTGKVQFKVTDIYTATRDSSNALIEGVNNARIKIQNENVLSITRDMNTNEIGEALFDLPVGRYAYRISATDHTSITGRVWIKPGVTTFEKAFLLNNLVNVEWSVREITVEDRYEVKLEATFKTHVPVALIVIKPLFVNLPIMKKGETFQGELTLTNYGLIRAENIKQSLPQNTDVARFEFLKEIPASLAAGQVFTLPYKIYALRDFNPATEALVTGGGCGHYQTSATVFYTSKCEEGTVVSNSASAGWGASWGTCPEIVDILGGSVDLGGGGGGDGWLSSPMPVKVQVGGGCNSDDPNDDSCDKGNGGP